MGTSTQTVVGVFRDYSTAHNVAEELKAEGFSGSDVHITNAHENTAAENEGGISGWFHRVFGNSDVSDDERGGYNEALQKGNAAVAVDVDADQVNDVIAVMEAHEPVKVDHPRVSRQASAQAENVIPVVKEELQVGKRTVQSGGVRVVSHVLSQPVEEELQLREEKVSVNRRAVDRPATDADFRRSENTIEMRETREEAVIGKQARVVEEITLGKEAAERSQTVRDNVRHTEVNVEQLDPGVRAAFQEDFRARPNMQAAGSFEEFSPAYEYGYTSAQDPAYRGRDWDTVESSLRESYLRKNPNRAWDQDKDAIQSGWSTQKA